VGIELHASTAVPCPFTLCGTVCHMLAAPSCALGVRDLYRLAFHAQSKLAVVKSCMQLQVVYQGPSDNELWR
jgi:hypothetical protein